MLAALMPMVCLLAACGPDRMPFRVVRVAWDSVEGAYVHAIPGMWSGETSRSATVLASPGTYLRGGTDQGDNGVPIPYRMSDGDSVHVEFTSWRGSIDGRVVSLQFGTDSAAAWLEQASHGDLAALRLVAFPADSPGYRRPNLNRLAAANPGVGLSFESPSALADILPHFRPRELWLPKRTESIAAGLSRQSQLETVWVSGSDSAGLDAVRSLPKLRRLVLYDADAELPVPLPTGLEALIVWDGDIALTALEHLSHLRLLSLDIGEWQGSSDLAALKQLRWVGFPHKTTQAEFEVVVKAHRDLEVVELVIADSVTDLSPLAGMQRLRALTTDRDVDLEVLGTLTSLEYLGLSEDLWRDVPERVAAIQAALPGVMLVKVKPVCLGSGWILLIVPVVLLVMLTAPRRRAARGHG